MNPRSIRRLASDDPDLRKVNGLITVHLAPTQIMAALSVEFDDKLSTAAIEDLVERLEERVRAVCPDVVALFIKPQTPGHFQELRWRRLGGRAQPDGATEAARTEGESAFRFNR